MVVQIDDILTLERFRACLESHPGQAHDGDVEPDAAEISADLAMRFLSLHDQNGESE